MKTKGIFPENPKIILWIFHPIPERNVNQSCKFSIIQCLNTKSFTGEKYPESKIISWIFPTCIDWFGEFLFCSIDQYFYTYRKPILSWLT